MRYVILYIPFIGASLLGFDPAMSYWVAWLGSFWIFFLVFVVEISPLPRDHTGSVQFLRPIVLTHIICAAYMSLTSVFFFLGTQGYYYFDYEPSRQIYADLNLVAACQRYYCLGHASFVAGLMLISNPGLRPKWQIPFAIESIRLLKLTVVFTFLSLLFQVLPGLGQFQNMVRGLSLVTSTMAMALALREKNVRSIFLSGVLFGLNLVSAFLSGSKEEVLVPVIILCIFVYPYYRKTVTLIGPAVLLFLFAVLPTFVSVIRQQAWSGEADSQTAAKDAVALLRNENVEMGDTNWEFLTGRLSEIGMFVQYAEYVPAKRDYYYFQIIGQGIQNLIPRIFYPGKPITEVMVMERVYEAGVVERIAIVSAKPPLVTDGYLSGGVFGVFILFLMLGVFAAWAAAKAEDLFGGYQVGTCLIFTGLFQVLWRPNCFEFLLNSLVWSAVFMFFLHWLGKKTGWLTRNVRNL